MDVPECNMCFISVRQRNCDRVVKFVHMKQGQFVKAETRGELALGVTSGTWQFAKAYGSTAHDGQPGGGLPVSQRTWLLGAAERARLLNADCVGVSYRLRLFVGPLCAPALPEAGAGGGGGGLLLVIGA